MFSNSPGVTDLTLSGIETISLASITAPQARESTWRSIPTRLSDIPEGASATFEGIAAGTSGQILYLHNASHGDLA